MSLNKAKDERITYPDIYFAVDRYEEFLHEISVSDGHIICIELVAINKKSGANSSLFLGSITHTVMSDSIKSGRFVSFPSPGLKFNLNTMVKSVDQITNLLFLSHSFMQTDGRLLHIAVSVRHE